jgi:hypothetical protein
VPTPASPTPDWSLLSAPVTVSNLTGWFILAPAGDAPRQSAGPFAAVPDSTVPDYGVPEYGVLDESIGDASTATAVLHETGSVGTLLIENTGDVDIFIQAGDIVKGGRQDRTIAFDFIVPARSGRIPLPAFCVEQARWHRRGGESAAQFSSSKHSVSSKKTQLALHFSQDQLEIWRSVADEQQRLSSALAMPAESAESPTSLELTYDLGHVTDALDDYTNPLEAAPAAAGREVVGVVWAIDGRPSHADRYVSPTLFRKRWRKLLRAAATEALMSRRGPWPPVDEQAVPATETIRDWLAAVTSAPTEEPLPPRTLVRRGHGEMAHRVECYDTAVTAAGPVHVTILAP